MEPYGTIQGSVLASLMYLIYILDFPLLFHDEVHNPIEDINCTKETALTYVDYINNTVKAVENTPLQNTMTDSLDKCKTYMNDNKLSLNKPKTKIFGISEDINIKESLHIPTDNNNENVTNKNTINILGIKINGNLKMNDHITNGKQSLICQLTSRINALKKLVKKSDFNFSLNLANGLFMSKLVYGIQAWGLAAKYLIQKLQVLQNTAAKTVLGYKAYKLSTIELLKKMNWLSVEKLITLHIGIMVNNILCTKEPEYLYLRLQNKNSNCNRSNLGRKLGQRPAEEGNSQFTKNQFVSRVYNIYNNIPSQITSIMDKKLFKKHLKTYLHTNLLPNLKDFPIHGILPGLD